MVIMNNEVSTLSQDRAFVSRLASQVNLPYKRQHKKEITKTNGNLTVRFVAGGDELPYGRYPRLIEIWLTTMIKTSAPCWNPQTRTISIGTSFRAFMRLIGAEIGGKSMHQIKKQLENLCSCAYFISNNDDDSSKGLNFTVAEQYNIDWLKPTEDGSKSNWIRLSEGYANKLINSTVPIDLHILSQLSKPMSLDIYLWLNHRFSYLHKPCRISWETLYNQFGSNSDIYKFRQNFKHALKDVLEAYPAAKVTYSTKSVTLYPSPTSLPTKAQKQYERQLAKSSRTAQNNDWHAQQMYGKDIWTTTELFNVDDVQNHLFGFAEPDTCPFCIADSRNTENHGSLS